MKAFIFCGHHNTGKTTFLRTLAGELTNLGYSVAYLKHITNPDKRETQTKLHDTENLLESEITTSIALLKEISITYTRNKFIPKKANDISWTRKILRDTLKQLHTDYILIEGFKHYDGPIPKVIFGNSEEDILGLYEEIKNYGIYIGYTGPHIEEIKHDEFQKLTYLSYTENNTPFFTSLNYEYTPDIDCGECGLPSCKEFIKEVINGRTTMAKCKPLQGDIKLYINNNPVYLKSFVGNTLKDIIKAYIKNLHDTPSEGSIKILIK